MKNPNESQQDILSPKDFSLYAYHKVWGIPQRITGRILARIAANGCHWVGLARNRNVFVWAPPEREKATYDPMAAWPTFCFLVPSWLRHSQHSNAETCWSVLTPLHPFGFIYAIFYGRHFRTNESIHDHLATVQCHICLYISILYPLNQVLSYLEPKQW